MIQNLKETTPCPEPQCDYVWSEVAFDYSTAYHNVERGTVSFTHQGTWVKK
jgi:hypothetical protein